MKGAQFGNRLGVMIDAAISTTTKQSTISARCQIGMTIEQPASLKAALGIKSIQRSQNRYRYQTRGPISEPVSLTECQRSRCYCGLKRRLFGLIDIFCASIMPNAPLTAGTDDLVGGQSHCQTPFKQNEWDRIRFRIRANSLHQNVPA
jgi:hypothetical protein